ncbi:MAG: hypothetical protein LBV00_05460 [Propionibacteriaceae bacterium]|nr:hypothetical protein [Propionibacteriaceae bacterium]
MADFDLRIDEASLPRLKNGGGNEVHHIREGEGLIGRHDIPVGVVGAGNRGKDVLNDPPQSFLPLCQLCPTVFAEEQSQHWHHHVTRSHKRFLSLTTLTSIAIFIVEGRAAGLNALVSGREAGDGSDGGDGVRGYADAGEGETGRWVRGEGQTGDGGLSSPMRVISAFDQHLG